MILAIAVTIVGLILIALTAFDVFMTVLHPQAESPFSSRLQLFIWKVMRMSARGLRSRARHRFLGLAVPVMIVSLVGAWVLLLLGAYGLIYAAWIPFPGAFRGPDVLAHFDWADALYFSGVTLGTLGYGDFQPLHPLLRMAAVIEGFSGVAALSMSIAYVLEIFPVLQRQRVLAVLLNEETAGQITGLPLLARYLGNGNFEALADLLRTVNLELLAVAEAHRRLPILHYAHPTEVEYSFLRVLLVTLNLVGALRYGVAGDDGRKWSEDPRVRDLEDSLFYALYTLGSSQNLPLTANADQKHRVQEVQAILADLLSQLKSVGLPTPDQDHNEEGKGVSSALHNARSGFLGLYLATDTALTSYVRNSGYNYVEATRNAVRPQRRVVELELDATE